MANLQLPFGIEVLNQKPEIAKYFLSGETPYNSVAEVNLNLVNGIRHQGLTVNILGVEYWYESGVADIDLVIKGTAGSINNVGSGNGEVYSGTSGNTIFLRTILGSGGTVVETVGDTIRVFSSGETTNLRAVEIANITTSFSANTSSDYISVSGSVTNVYMPQSPPIGQQVTISDDAGNSNTFPIIVYGSGNLIDDSATALINTDHGSITILYNGTFWKVISFSN